MVIEASLEIAADVLLINSLMSIHAGPPGKPINTALSTVHGLAARDCLPVSGALPAGDIWRALKGTLRPAHNIFVTILTAFPLGILWISVSVIRINQNKSGRARTGDN